jgi:SAM-dependent methyltransferase
LLLEAGDSGVTERLVGTSVEATLGRMAARLFLISVLALYLELLLIRWIGTEIRIFAYLQNTVLVVCFFGLGIGLFTADRAVEPWKGARALLLLAVLLLIPVTRDALMEISQTLSVLGQLNIWYQVDFGGKLYNGLAVVAGLVGTFALMMLIMEPFVPLGRVLGRLLDDHPQTIVAYSVNVFGSLVGIWLFVFLSSQLAPPPVWFGVLFLLYLPFLLERPAGWLASAIALLIIVPVTWFSLPEGAVRTVWSPYQKLTIYDRELYTPVPEFPGKYLITVNNVGYQAIIDLGDDGSSVDPVVGEHPYKGFSQYDLPFLLHPRPEDVLLVGAGAGNDASGALRNGAMRITAVEIDPVILELGEEFHPEAPYHSERVRTVTDDARSFFASTTERYDVIVFGQLDSHTTTAMTNARLDHYVYTRESLRQANRLLKPGGIIFLNFYVANRPFIPDRIAVILRDVFGEEPIAFRLPASEVGWGGATFVAGDLEAVRKSMADQDRLRALIATWTSKLPLGLTYTTKPTTDDWPYLYLEHPRIPILFVLLGGLMGLLVLHAKRAFKLPAVMNPARWTRENWHFGFLGAGFLLLEVQNISKAAVVLGNTWVVNAVVISGILAMVLLANLLVSRRPRIPMTPVYTALIGSTLALFFVDLARFAFLPFPIKAAVVGLLTSLPILFSGVAFMRAFARVEQKDTALGANLLGALVGAVLQSLSFLIGVKALLLLVALFYGVAFRTRYRQASEQPEPGSVEGESVVFG